MNHWSNYLSLSCSTYFRSKELKFSFSSLFNRRGWFSAWSSFECQQTFIIVIDMANVHHLLKDLKVRIDSLNITKISIVWSYLGLLYKQPNEKVDLDRFYCKVCFEKLKEEKLDVSLSSIRKQIGVYSSTSSTGNMRHHLLVVHKITEPQQVKTTHEHIQSIFSQKSNLSVVCCIKEKLTHQLTLMCCRDLLPFSVVENSGKFFSPSALFPWSKKWFRIFPLQKVLNHRAIDC